MLDGDNVRHGLNANLGFSPEDRAENIRRVGEVAGAVRRRRLRRDHLVHLALSLRPRPRARQAAGGSFHEVYIEAALETCEKRDPKGLYARRARTGEIPEFTGIAAPYEPPENPDLAIRTDLLSVEECLSELAAYVERTFAPET